METQKQKLTFLQKSVGVWKFVGASPIDRVLPLIYRRKKVVSEPRDPLLHIPVIELAAKIRNKEITSESVVRAYIARIKEVNPLINALVEDRFEEALSDARLADELVLKLSPAELEQRYPLLGIPFTVKEPCKLKGLSFECAIPSRRGTKADEDGAAVKLLRDAGGIPLGVSNVPELCMSWETNNTRYGRTHNPYDTTRTPAGSSGGEGALIGAGASLFGIASDFMGSIRLPAAFCGVFGLRPTSPLVTVEGGIPASGTDERVRKLLSFGPICRYAKDLPLVTRVMCGENASQLSLDAPVEVAKLKVFHVPEFEQSIEFTSIQPEIEFAIAQAVSELRREGAEIDMLPTDVEFNHLFEKVMQKTAELPRRPMLEYSDISVTPNIMSGIYREYGKWLFGKSDHTFVHLGMEFMLRSKNRIQTENYETFVAKADELEAQLETLLDDRTVLIIPVFPRVALHHNGIITCATGIQFVTLCSVMNFPAVAVPIGLNKEGLPMSLQVVAGRFKDHLCIAVAQFLEQKMGGWVPPGGAQGSQA